jgi:hypothetical protein
MFINRGKLLPAIVFLTGRNNLTTVEFDISVQHQSSGWISKVLTLCCALALLVGIVTPTFSQNADSLVVVVNSKSPTNSLTKKELIDIYMGRFNKFPNGESVTPIDFNSGSIHREMFYESLVAKSERKINAYWSRLLFSGRATPPQKAASASDVASIIQNNTNALAYLLASDVQPGMKIVYEFK